MRNTSSRWPLVAGALTLIVAACGRAPASDPEGLATPVYNQQTGRLEQIASDRDGDGRVETRAYMDGTRLVRIEMDRDGDDRLDRWEFYRTEGEPPVAVIERAEEAGGTDGVITRRETYVGGVLERVEEDTSLDGRPDKWETYQEGRLVRVELDLAGRGTPTRRLVYGADGNVARLESDADGDGVFELLPAQGNAR
jgi:hypothetical protein